MSYQQLDNRFDHRIRRTKTTEKIKDAEGKESVTETVVEYEYKDESKRT